MMRVNGYNNTPQLFSELRIAQPRPLSAFLNAVRENPITKLQVNSYDWTADRQSLYYSARQNPLNLANYHKWVGFEEESFGYPGNFCKAISDAPSLIKAVEHDQKMVVNYTIRKYSDKFKFLVPTAINGVVFLFYIQPAIYPVPLECDPIYFNKYDRLFMYNEPIPCWTIHPEESLADFHHPLNVQDRLNLEKAKDTVRLNWEDLLNALEEYLRTDKEKSSKVNHVVAGKWEARERWEDLDILRGNIIAYWGKMLSPAKIKMARKGYIEW